MELLKIFQNRRSVRQYTGEAIPEETLKKIVQAGLLSASGRGRRPWELIVVRDKGTLAKMAECRVGAAQMLGGAECAIAVLGDTTKSDTVIEDCSIVLANMHLMADALGVGSCWIQGRLRTAPDGRTTEEYLRELLGFPETLQLEAILSLGIPAKHPAPTALEDLPYDKIHSETY